MFGIRNRPNLAAIAAAYAHDFIGALRWGEGGGRPDAQGVPREAMVVRYLRESLGASIGVCKGHILYPQMSNGVLDVSLSSEFDIIFYDRQRAPAFLKSPDGAVRIVPYEDVYGIVEVKSTLSEKTAEDCSKKVMELRGLAELVAETKTASSMRAMAKQADTVFDFVPNIDDDEELTRTAPFAFVIAYKADYEGSASAHFSQSAVASMGRPTAIFVIDRGYSVRMHNREANHDITVAARALITGLPKSIVGQSMEHFSALEWEVATPYLDHEYVNFDCSSDRCILSFITLASDACRAQVLEDYDLTSLIGGWANHTSKPTRK